MHVPCQHVVVTARRRRGRQAALLLLAAALGGGIVFANCDGKLAFDAWLLRHGHHAVEHRTPTWRALVEMPRRLLADAPAPHLDLEIAFKHVLTLRAAQQAALRKGFIDAESKQEVPAHVDVGGVGSEAKLRLKGDHLDHVSDRKVSFRVQITGEQPVLGLRAFSLQSPPTKGFQLEALFHATVRHFGGLSPRYEFVRASYNGDDLGVMALEEHCAKELLERNGRRDNVVVRFEEEPMFAAQARLRTSDPHLVVVDDYRAAAVQPLGREDAYPDQATALGLLRAFVAGTLPPAQVFDVEELATYLAVCELWGVWHPLRWHNLRFHYDPLRGRLAPIGFDGNLHMRRPVGHLVTPEEPVIAHMLRDAEVFAAFRRRLGAVCAEAAGGGLITALAAVDAGVLPILQREYWLLQAFPADELRERAAYLAGLQDGSFQSVAADAGVVPLLVSAIAPGRYELRNVTPWAVCVHGLRWVRPDGSTLAAELPAAWQPHLTLPARPATGVVPDVELALEPPAGERALVLEVESRVATVGERWFARAVPQPAAARETPLPERGVGAQVAENPWLRADEDERTLRVAVGQHQVRATVVLPRGFRLLVEAGTELVFAADAALVVQGAMLVDGHAGAPVVLRGASDAGWLGVAVLGDGTTASRWQHVRVCDTRGVRAGQLTFTGGVVFDRGEVTLHDVLLSGTRAEDALNIVRAAVQLQRVHFERTDSDAFDGDFVRGTVADCVFTTIAGDALDLSGASVSVRDCRMRDVRDKALSVGEGGRVIATGLVAEDCGVGAACKDGATLLLGDTRIVRARTAAAMAYVKKPEFGPCRLELTRLACEGDAPAVRVQHGSVGQRDGVALPTEAIDVQQLYDTVMRKR